MLLRLVSGALGAMVLLTLPDRVDAQRRGRDWPPQHRRATPSLALDAGGLFARGASGGTGDASGFDVMGSVGTGLFAIGGGYQRSTLRQSAAGAPSETLDGFFVEPRLALPIAVGNVTPYLFGRAGWLTTARTAGTAGTVEASASQVGGGVGTLFWLAPQLQLNAAVFAVDTRAPNTRFDGASVGVRAGLTIGFDRWGR